MSYNGGQHQIILGSLTELQRLFTNLVENAVSHAKEVVVTLTQPSGKLVQVDVSDDGPGIPDADKARVLEPFVRGEPARTVTRPQRLRARCFRSCARSSRSSAAGWN